MDLAALKLDIQKQVQQNKIDVLKHQQAIEGLQKGATYLRGQLDLIEHLMVEQATNNLKEPTTPAEPLQLELPMSDASLEVKS